MQAVARGEIPDFIQSQRMKTCKKGGEEGHRGEVKCTHSPFQSYLHFSHVLFPIFFPLKVHSFLTLLLFFSILACLINLLLYFFSVFAQSPSPSSSHLQSGPHLLTLVQTPEGKWWCNYALHNIREHYKTKQKKKRPCLHCFIIRYMFNPKY